MQIEVTNTVPVPASRSRKGTCKYPFATMNVGDSFFVALSTHTFDAYIRSWKARSQSTFKFTVRTVTENGVKGVRVWRIA